MELSNDQKAILRLLAQRGAAGYDDLTALLGIDAAEVHERAKAAAAQLEADGIPAPSIPAPGAAAPESPAEPAAPAEPPQPEPVTTPEPEPPAPTAVEMPAPAPSAPVPPQPRSQDSQPPQKPGSRPKLSLPKSNGARAALGLGIAAVVAMIVVLALGGGDDSGDTTTSGASTAASGEAVDTSANPKLTQAVLDPVDGSDAKGVATFGRVKNSLALQVEAEGLEPTGKGESYTIWLYESAQKMLPLASTAVGEDGKIGAQVEVPVEVLAYLAKETFDQLDISLTTDATLKASLAKATKEKAAPIYTGTDVLRGTITGPIIGAADRVKAGK
ncbi:MAG TPA: hypothetical protein VEW07_01790 [Solirubrobacterales bacterium]|nr:hypothetical protein [Solirubrobacterales bacterium]